MRVSNYLISFQKLPSELNHTISSFSGAKELQILAEVSKYWHKISSNPKVWNALAKKLNISIENPIEAKHQVVEKKLNPRINDTLEIFLRTEECCLASFTVFLDSNPEPLKKRLWLLDHFRLHSNDPQYLKLCLNELSKNTDFEKEKELFVSVFKILFSEKILSPQNVISALLDLLENIKLKKSSLEKQEYNLILMHILIFPFTK